jgi:hypothetical protein
MNEMDNKSDSKHAWWQVRSADTDARQIRRFLLMVSCNNLKYSAHNREVI